MNKTIKAGFKDFEDKNFKLTEEQKEIATKILKGEIEIPDIDSDREIYKIVGHIAVFAEKEGFSLPIFEPVPKKKDPDIRFRGVFFTKV